MTLNTDDMKFESNTLREDDNSNLDNHHGEIPQSEGSPLGNMTQLLQ